MQINGIAHIYLTVQNFDKCLPFYKKLLDFFEMTPLVVTDELYYCIGGRTGVGVRAASAEHKDTEYDQYRAGFHHLCFRARSRESIDELNAFMEKEGVPLGAKIVHGPQEDEWAPGYYSILFEDPDGLRLEVNFVPGKGHLDKDAKTPLADDVQKNLKAP